MDADARRCFPSNRSNHGALCQPEETVKRLSGMTNSLPEEMLAMRERRTDSWRDVSMEPTHAELVELLFREGS